MSHTNAAEILLVEDNPQDLELTQRVLRKANLANYIHIVRDGAEALEKCRKTLPAAVLLDWNMPNMDGIQFLRTLRKMAGGDKPKVVFCTTENDVGSIARALHAGADEYIMKPFDKEIVAAKLQQVGLV